MNNPHDVFFKETMTRRENAVSFFREYLPAEIVSQADWRTLRIVKETFVTPELRERFSDIVYEVRLKGHLSALRTFNDQREGKQMNTERLILDTDNKGNLRGLPKFPPNKKVEAIFRIVDKPEQKICVRRFPHRDIAGKIRIMGNIFDTVSETDWDLPK